MASATQKEEELGHLANFLKISGLGGTPRPVEDGSGPDFVLATEQGEIGIEVTKLHREAPASGLGRRQMEGIREQILVAAKKLWDEAGEGPIEVHVHFNHHRTPFKHEIAGAASNLVNFVQSNRPPVGEHLHFSWNDTKLPDGAHAISVVLLGAHTRSYWLGADSDWEQPLSAEQLQARISSKNQKIARYRAAANVVWLLIVLDSRRFSGWFDLESAALLETYESLFTRTIVFDRFSGIVRELSTRRGGNGTAV